LEEFPIPGFAFVLFSQSDSAPAPLWPSLGLMIAIAGVMGVLTTIVLWMFKTTRDSLLETNQKLKANLELACKSQAFAVDEIKGQVRETQQKVDKLPAKDTELMEKLASLRPIIEQLETSLKENRTQLGPTLTRFQTTIESQVKEWQELRNTIDRTEGTQPDKGETEGTR
jgi:uncharacterized protein involved in exopolysaccharide biosynthesis